MNKTTGGRIKLARAIAVCADLLQLGLFPFFAPGLFSPIDDALDLMVCAVLTWLVGWHFSFLPSFAVKVLPVVDLAPTWTIAVFLATRQKYVAPPGIPTEVYADPPAPQQLQSPQIANK